MYADQFVTDVNLTFNGIKKPGIVLSSNASGLTALKWFELTDAEKDIVSASLEEADALTQTTVGGKSLEEVFKSSQIFKSGTAGNVRLSPGSSIWHFFVNKIQSVGIKPTIPQGPIYKDLVYYGNDDQWHYMIGDGVVTM